MEKILVLGASLNPERYSHKVVKFLECLGYEVEAIGATKGLINSVEVHSGTPNFSGIGIVLLYLSPKNQIGFYKYILRLKPAKLVFNPGTENLELQNIAENSGIEVLIDCAFELIKSGKL